MNSDSLMATPHRRSDSDSDTWIDRRIDSDTRKDSDR